MTAAGLTTACLPIAVLLVAGLVGARVGEPAWVSVRRDMPALAGGDLQAAAGEGLTIGLLGGFRAVAADFLWVRTNAVWEDQDLAGTQALIRLVTIVDPRPLLFWINGARMIAYDMPVWRIDAARGIGAEVPRAVQVRITREQAAAAIELLERAVSHHPDEPLVVIEHANIVLRKLGDLEQAAALYRRAALMPGAPYYAARIHAELLRQMGRHREALDWLVAVHRRLPADDPRALWELVFDRIRELEDVLQVPAPQRYAPIQASGAGR